jgi:hypothetical protein
MIARIWHGWTNMQNADAYEQLLNHEIFVNIADKNIDGYKGIELLKRINNGENEFITIMYFESLDTVSLQERITRLPLFRKMQGDYFCDMIIHRSTMKF